MIKIGIVGISGYSGLMILELLLKHPDVCVTYVSANNTTGKLDAIWPRLKGTTKLTCSKYDFKKAVKLCDLVFLAVPHTVSMKITPELLNAKLRIIDLSADYRLPNAKQYEKWYGLPHKDKRNLRKAVYGLPEFYREHIKNARLIANPGCYPTAAILALAPMSAIYGKDIDSIIIDAKSGVTGAGRKAGINFSFSEINENFKAYKVLRHQHTPEIDLYLSKISDKALNVNFVPHLLPISRGILETIYVQLNSKTTLKNLYDIYKKFYKTEPFVRILQPGQQPEFKNVVGTNYCDIGIDMKTDNRLAVITSVIDNLIKGAAGQAVQNMNIMYGFKEDEGLLCKS